MYCDPVESYRSRKKIKTPTRNTWYGSTGDVVFMAFFCVGNNVILTDMGLFRGRFRMPSEEVRVPSASLCRFCTGPTGTPLVSLQSLSRILLMSLGTPHRPCVPAGTPSHTSKTVHITYLSNKLQQNNYFSHIITQLELRYSIFISLKKRCSW